MNLNQSLALLLLMALLLPVFLFNPVWKTSAQQFLLPSQSVPVSAPPQPYAFPNDESDTTDSFASTLKSAKESISEFFAAPQLPEGFEMAKPVSPASAYVSSTFALFFAPKNSKPASASNSNSVSPPLPAGTIAFDFDNDGKADFARWRGSNGGWSVKLSSDDSIVTHTLGSSSDKIAPADYDNDGLADYAVFVTSTGEWTIHGSKGTNFTLALHWQSGDKPVVGDYDGDSKADPAVWRSSNGTWYVAESTNGYTVASYQFGQSGDIPVPGDYDGDGSLDKAVYRPTGGYWYVLGTTSGFVSAQWGLSADIPVPADYDGDNKTDYSVYRGSTGSWYAYKSSGTNGQYISQTWGNYGDQPVPADYDGDGQADFAVWRPKTGNWHVMKSCNYNGTCSQGNLYKYAQLGANGDFPAEASYLKQIGALVQGYELNEARLSPKNATGGTDLYSRNFSWGAGLVSLPGRAGLNAGFGMSYNSLIWTKQGNNIYFDTDASNISPGFRFGFPVIEPAYYADGDKDVFSYLMVTPSGGRVEFRQLSGASDTYEAADSSYVQLKTVGATNPNDPAENITITVTGTDGTKMSYEWKAGAFRCSKITDRNGNYIDINHDEYGLLRTVTDTLGRVVTVYYDSEFYPTSIKQTWKDNNGAGSNVTRTYATFTYTTQTITTNFNSTAITNNYGPPNSTVIKVLQKVTFPTETNLAGPSTVFSYNTWGQVNQITNYSADYSANDPPLNYVKINLPANATGSSQTDCPRFTETRSWVKNFNLGGQNNQEQEVIVNNSFDESQTYSLPGSITGSATLLKVWMTGHPDNLISRTYVGASGWKESLPIATEDCISSGCTGSDRKRWTWTNWTQDNTNLSYLQNPRVTETKVGDGTSTKRTTVEYLTDPNTYVVQYGLTSAVNVYEANQTSVLKRSETDYNLSSTYTSRRIIGLPSESRLYDENSNLMSKVTYGYDGENFSYETEQNISPIMHDTTNFGTGFAAGRGNHTSVTRWDAAYPTDSNKAVTSKIRFDVAGSPVASIDPLGRKIKTSYLDKFNHTTSNLYTYAYPTKVTEVANTDTNNNFSEIKYRFDIGANVWAKSPKPEGNNTGKETTREFDAVGRLLKATIVNTGAYTRYEYLTNGVQAKSYTTIINEDGDSNLQEDEVLSESWADGAGRVLRSRTEHPNSSAGWMGSLAEYDILGRVKRSTAPREISVNTSTNEWTPAGDDSAGWLWAHKKYDWKGRVTRIINTDGTDSTTLNDSDQLFSYDGCGCAGGEVVTIQGELVPVPGQSGSERRKQKIYSDILGRQKKTEIYEWNGTTVYTTTVNTFNGRDQITETKQYAGAEGTNITNQSVTMTYDGHGRMKTRHYPVEDAQTETTWIYNADDSVQQVIDPRGVITSFTYNNRGLVEEIAYAPPANYPPANSPSYMNILDVPNVKFTYDALGNRITMEDGLGPANSPGVTYEYNELSQMTAETRHFGDSLEHAPQNGYRIEYTYNLSGGLKSVTDPFGSEITYTHDKKGRLRKVDGDAFGNNTGGHYADNISYRAFGQVKQMNYKTDDNAEISLAFDNRLRISQYQVASNEAPNDLLKKAQFAYLADSRPQSVDDQVNGDFDRTFQYDFVGRLTANQFGNAQATNPYSQTLQYDRFSQLTSRAATHWDNYNSFTASYTNGRKQPELGQTPVYDAAGNQIYSGARASTGQYQSAEFDAANRRRKISTRSVTRVGRYSTWTFETTLNSDYDGEGHLLKQSETNQRVGITPLPPPTTSEVKYAVWSTVLGGELTELSETGRQNKTKVYAGGAVIAEQTPGYQGNQSTGAVHWLHADPVTGSRTRVMKSGEEFDRTELEPLGQEILTEEPPEIETAPSGESAYKPEEPEWLCQRHEKNGTDMFERPVQCQIAAFETLDLKYLFAPKNSPSSIPDAGKPLSPTARKKDLPVNPTPTDKPHNETSSIGVTPESSSPNDYGYVNLQEKKVTVIASSIDVTATPGVGASQSDADIQTVSSQIQTTFPERRRLTCIFNINLEVPKEWLKTDYYRQVPDTLLGEGLVTDEGHLHRLKRLMMEKFEKAGAFLVFNNEKAASETRRGSYNLKFTEKFTGLLGLAGAILEPNALGISFRDKGQVALGKIGSLASDQAEIGVHESGHWFLGNYPGNDRSGHSEGIMTPFYKPGRDDQFSREQAKFLSSLCNENKP